MEDHHHNNPLVCIKEMTRLAREGKAFTLEFWDHETHVQRFAIDTAIRIRDGGDPIFGAQEIDEAELALAIEDCALSLGCGDCDAPPVTEFGAPRGIVLQMLAQLAMAWVTNPANLDKLAELLKRLIEQQ